jgi:hypothetical protein
MPIRFAFYLCILVALAWLPIGEWTLDGRAGLLIAALAGLALTAATSRAGNSAIAALRGVSEMLAITAFAAFCAVTAYGYLAAHPNEWDRLWRSQSVAEAITSATPLLPVIWFTLAVPFLLLIAVMLVVRDTFAENK